MDLTSLLPLLGLGGANGPTADLAALLGALGGSVGATPPPPPPVDVSPGHAGGRPDYAKLYPGSQRIADLPRRDAPRQADGGIDPAKLIGLLAAMRQTGHAAPAPAPTATAEIRDCLRSILELNAVGP